MKFVNANEINCIVIVKPISQLISSSQCGGNQLTQQINKGSKHDQVLDNYDFFYSQFHKEKKKKKKTGRSIAIDRDQQIFFFFSLLHCHHSINGYLATHESYMHALARVYERIF